MCLLNGIALVRFSCISNLAEPSNSELQSFQSAQWHHSLPIFREVYHNQAIEWSDYTYFESLTYCAAGKWKGDWYQGSCGQAYPKLKTYIAVKMRRNWLSEVLGHLAKDHLGCKIEIMAKCKFVGLKRFYPLNTKLPGSISIQKHISWNSIFAAFLQSL